MKKNTNVLFLINFNAPHKGNFIESMQELSKSVDSYLYVFNEEAKNCFWVDELSNLHYENEFGSLFKTLKNLIKANNINIIHVHFPNLTYLTTLKLISLIFKVKIIFHHHIWYTPHKNRLKNFILKRLFSAGYHIGVSPDLTKDLTLAFGKKKVVCINNGIVFSRLDRETDLDLSLFKNSNAVLFLGYDIQTKGGDIAIQAMEKVCEKHPRTRLVILLAKDNKNRAYYEQFNFVTILESTNYIGQYYKKSKCFISPSRIETFGYAPVEATYCKCPVIASDCKGQKSVYCPSKIEFESENAEDLCNKIIELIETPENELDPLLETGKRYVLENYNVEKWRDEMVKYFHSLIGNDK